MEQFYPIIIWVILTLVPMCPTWVMHRFLESTAVYQKSHGGIKLGGAIAAYFILLTTGALMYHNLIGNQPTTHDPFTNLRQEITGTWWCGGTIVDSQNEDLIDTEFEDSYMSVSVTSLGHITMSGFTNGLSWNADEVILTDNKLVYLFEVPVRSISGSTFMRFARDMEQNIVAMHGQWAINGARGKGTVVCEADGEQP